MPRVLARGLAWLVLALVVAGCTAGGGGNSSRWEQREIDHVLNSAFSESLSQLQDFLDDEVALGFSDGEPVPVPRDMVAQILQAYIGGAPESPDLSPSPGPGPDVNLAFESKYVRIEQATAWAQGLLYIRGATHEAEIGLRRNPSGDWKISRLKILLNELLNPVGNESLVGEWSGRWWSQAPYDGSSGDLSVSFTQTSDGQLSGRVVVQGHGCYGGGTIISVSTFLRPTWVTEGMNVFFADGPATDSALSGQYVFCAYDVGRFELTKN